MDRNQLADLTSPEAGGRAREGVVLVVPVGSTEQHGPHLPLSTDTDIAVALCAHLARARTDVVVAPPVPYGSSGEHAGFPGSLSIGQAALEFLITEVCRSAFDTFDHVLLVNGHGGNVEPLTRAVTTLRNESRDVCLFLPRWEGDPHAGHEETSMQLALRPERVQMQHAVPGDTRPLSVTLPLMRRGGVRAASRNGILGDPTHSTAQAGARLLAQLGADLFRAVDEWRRSMVAIR
ncbi:mycofactocin biosynthesis peptidyl-dipeptidase MftE [Jatrophihabitans sp. GAS493]|uniref:mycofactocin biosynthesis peptidyl-dipeptidase MftE n=1 Tax=Jatrophihabitans sp. GAS493 TaxID=1907575 RepID=UPI000BB7994F